jgi:glycosyltransferase involved in cell wall biosynthesis
MKTVIHLIDSEEMGGTERVALDLLTSLDRGRWRPVLFHHGSPGHAPFLAELNRARIETRIVPRIDTARQLSRLPAFVRAIRAERPALLHAHLTWPLSCKYGLLAATVARVPAVVATAHTHLLPEMVSKRSVTVQPRFIAAMVDRYLAVSDSVAGQLHRDLHIPLAKIQVVRNGIDLTRWQRARNEALRARLTCGRSLPIVVSVARLDPNKGLHHLVDAAVGVPDAVFIVAGDGPERATLESRALARGVGDRVRFVGHHHDVAELLACADVFVLPSLSEGLPLSVMEAMAAGVPVIGTSIAGVAELVTPGETGLLVPPADAVALTTALRTLLSDPARARALARAAHARALREFGSDRVTHCVSAVYRELLAHTA